MSIGLSDVPKEWWDAAADSEPFAVFIIPPEAFGLHFRQSHDRARSRASILGLWHNLW